MNKVEVGSDCTVHIADKNIPHNFFCHFYFYFLFLFLFIFLILFYF